MAPRPGRAVLGWAAIRARAYPPAADESPRHVVEVAPFRIGRIPVTNAQYAAFVRRDGASSAELVARRHRAAGAGRRARHLRLLARRGRVLRVGRREAPERGRVGSRGEWRRRAPLALGRRAARPHPSGVRAGIGGPRVAGRLPARRAPCGALDMAGNVAEWVATAYAPYPADGAATTPSHGVVRGGSYIHGADALRCSARRPLLVGRDRHLRRVPGRGRSGRGPCAWISTSSTCPAAAASSAATRSSQAARHWPTSCPAGWSSCRAFEISATPVTNAGYAAFVRETGHRPPLHWPDGEPPPGTDEHPVTWVDADDAAAFCAWSASACRPRPSGRRLRAVRTHEPIRGATSHPTRRVPSSGTAAWRRGPRSVGASPGGASPYGLLDMAGNVWEWVSSAYAPYPYDAGDGREQSPAAERMLRGGSYASPAVHLRCAARSRSYPGPARTPYRLQNRPQLETMTTQPRSTR